MQGKVGAIVVVRSATKCQFAERTTTLRPSSGQFVDSRSIVDRCIVEKCCVHLALGTAQQVSEERKRGASRVSSLTLWVMESPPYALAPASSSWIERSGRIRNHMKIATTFNPAAR